MMPLWVFIPLSCVVSYIGWWFIQPIFTTFKSSHPLKHQQYYHDTTSRNVDYKYVRFPFLKIVKDASIQLSIVLPVYNAETTLPSVMKTLLDYLHVRVRANPQFTFEIIVVDDASVDSTPSIALKYVDNYTCDSVRLMRLDSHIGVAGSVQQGVLHARGARILTLDLDNIDCIFNIDVLEASLNDSAHTDRYGRGMCIASLPKSNLKSCVGVGVGIGHCIIATFFKTLIIFLSGLTHTNTGSLPNVRYSLVDIEFPVRLFTRAAAADIFPNIHSQLSTYLFETLFIAEQLEIPVTSVVLGSPSPSQLHGLQLSVRASNNLDKSVSETTSGKNERVEKIDSKGKTCKYSGNSLILTLIKDLFAMRLCYGLCLWSILTVKEVAHLCPKEYDDLSHLKNIEIK